MATIRDWTLSPKPGSADKTCFPCVQLRQSQGESGEATWNDMSAFKKPFVSPAPRLTYSLIVVPFFGLTQILTLNWL